MQMLDADMDFMVNEILLKGARAIKKVYDEEPSAPVYVDGEHHTTLRGDDIVAQFIEILEAYVVRRFGAETETST